MTCAPLFAPLFAGNSGQTGASGAAGAAGATGNTGSSGLTGATGAKNLPMHVVCVCVCVRMGMPAGCITSHGMHAAWPDYVILLRVLTCN